MSDTLEPRSDETPSSVMLSLHSALTAAFDEEAAFVQANLVSLLRALDLRAKNSTTVYGVVARGQNYQHLRRVLLDINGLERSEDAYEALRRLFGALDSEEDNRNIRRRLCKTRADLTARKMKAHGEQWTRTSRERRIEMLAEPTEFDKMVEQTVERFRDLVDYFADARRRSCPGTANLLDQLIPRIETPVQERGQKRSRK